MAVTTTCHSGLGRTDEDRYHVDHEWGLSFPFALSRKALEALDEVEQIAEDMDEAR